MSPKLSAICILKVNDHSVKVGQYDDVSAVQKFELTEEEYAKKRGKIPIEESLNF